MPFSLLLRTRNKGKHGFYTVNSQTESITRLMCRELKFLITLTFLGHYAENREGGLLQRMGMELCLNRFTEIIEKKTRKSQENGH